MNLGNTIINSREDLDALEGTVEHAEFMTLLEGSMYLVQRDDINRRFVAIEDNSIIEKFGFTRADFPNAQPPELPIWTPPPSDVPQAVSPLQAKAVLLQQGSLAAVEAYVESSTDPLVKLAWTNAIECRRPSPMVAGIASALGWTDEQLDDLFIAAAKITA